MRRVLHLIFIGATMIAVGCTDSTKNQTGQADNHVPHPSDTLYTQQAAMAIYAYQPKRALQIVDSAVIVGNISQWKANQLRARIYSSTQMHEQMDSLLGGPKDVRMDSARAIGLRLLDNDSVNSDLKRRLDVLELLSYVARMQDDTTAYLQRSQEFVETCHQLGASQHTNALRMEAEIGAALWARGQQKEGVAKLDSAIYQLESSFHRVKDGGRFAELDALIIALKRKIGQLASHKQYVETLSSARLIIKRLDDYEQHPDKYHDGSYREPKSAQKRADYIHFYRSQAQNYITAAYVSLGEQENMLSAFEKIENSVREATAREHLAHYAALEQQLEAEREHAAATKAKQLAVIISILALLLLVFVIVIIFKNRSISRKNRLLAKQIAETVNYKTLYLGKTQNQENSTDDMSELSGLTDEQMFRKIDDVVMREHLFLNPKFGRQTVMERFHLSKEKVGTIFSKGSNHAKMTSYIQQLRLEYAAKLLVEHPEKSIVQIANECGFSSNTYFSNCFRLHFSISPSDFRRDALEQSAGE